MGYSAEEKSQIIRLFYSNNSVAIVRHQYHQIYPRRRIPSINTIKNVIRHFEERNSVQRKKRTVERNLDEELDILLYYQGNENIPLQTFQNTTYYFLENPEYSIPDVEKMSGKSYSKIQRTLKRHKYHPYRFLPVQNLNDEHRRQRLAYCAEILRRYQEDGDFFNKIIFTDEASFTTAGVFNRKNKHFWGMENPHQIQAVKICTGTKISYVK